MATEKSRDDNRAPRETRGEDLTRRFGVTITQRPQVQIRPRDKATLQVAGRPQTLHQSTEIAAVRHRSSHSSALRQLSDDRRLVVSEPLGDLRAPRREVLGSAHVVIGGGAEQNAASSLVALRGPP